MSTVHDAPPLTVESTRTYRRHVEEAATFFEEAAPSIPSLGLVLEAGLDGLGDAFDAQWTGSIGEVPHVPEVDDDTDPHSTGSQFEAIKEDVQKRQAEQDEDEKKQKRSRSKEDEEEASTEEIEKIWSILEDME